MEVPIPNPLSSRRRPTAKAPAPELSMDQPSLSVMPADRLRRRRSSSLTSLLSRSAGDERLDSEDNAGEDELSHDGRASAATHVINSAVAPSYDFRHKCALCDPPI
jgi:hypothetical protein